MKISELKNNKIAILGFGREGKSTKRFLEKLGINNFEILDKNPPLAPPYKVGEIKYCFGEDYLDNLERFDLIFRSPGVSPYNLKGLKKVSEKLITQAEIFFNNYNGKVIGITGTKGKSTVSTLLYEILKNLDYKVKLVGNIGNPVLDEIDILKNEKYDFIVYELSSYMLEGFSPNLFAGLLNNIYNCHLDWHDGKNNYKNAKLNILKNSLHKFAGLELKENLEKLLYSDINYFSSDFEFNKNDIVLKGEHNIKNIAGVLKILSKIDNNYNKDKVLEVLKNFNGLPHRQENIGTYKGITFINDSIASAPESTIAAIKTFGNNIGTLLVGNEDSGFDLSELEETIKEFNIENIVLFPTTGEKLFDGFGKNMDFDKPHPNPLLQGEGTKGFILKTLSMEEAVKFSYKNTKSGKIVLLSTGAPSFNANGIGLLPWKNYEEKGQLFKKYVEKYSK